MYYTLCLWFQSFYINKYSNFPRVIRLLIILSISISSSSDWLSSLRMDDDSILMRFIYGSEASITIIMINFNWTTNITEWILITGDSCNLYIKKPTFIKTLNGPTRCWDNFRFDNLEIEYSWCNLKCILFLFLKMRARCLTSYLIFITTFMKVITLFIFSRFAKRNLSKVFSNRFKANNRLMAFLTLKP